MSVTEPTTRPDTAVQPAWKSRRAWLILLMVTALGLAADLGSKQLAFKYVADQPVEVNRDDVLAGGPLSRLIPPHDPVVVVPRALEFTLVLNPGAVFGIGAGKRWSFILFTGGAIVFALWMFASWTRPRDCWAHAGIALLLAGGLGNLYDRLVFGCVRDFIHPLPRMLLPNGWSYPWGTGVSGREVWPYVSNAADLFLIIGIGMLVIYTWRSGSRQSK